MESFNWVYSILLVAIIGGVTIAIFAIYFKTRKDIAAGRILPSNPSRTARRSTDRSWRDSTRWTLGSRLSRTG